MRLFRRAPRLLWAFTLIGIAGSVPAEVSELKLIRHEYIPESEQIRISEWFTGRENPGRRQYLRSRPDARSGYYFVISIPAAVKPLLDAAETSFRIRIYPGETLRPLEYQFPFPESAQPSRPFYIGLTGTDWPEPNQLPIAWKIELLGPDPAQTTLASWQSHLWSDRE